MQDKDRKLQQAEGGKEESTEQTKASLEQATQAEPKVAEDTVSETEGSNEPESKAVPTEDSDDKSPKKEESNDHLDEIDESNAEDAEDTENEKRHTIPMLDYHSMSMENLVGELQRLVKNEKVQAINKHVSAIKYEFDQKFQDFLDEKKEEFISKGGNEVDFRYNSVAKRQFNEVYSDFREKRDQYYKQLDQSLKTNLQKRLEIIEELKGLIDIEEDINTTYNNFKDLQNRWKNAGPIPRANYNDVWRTYHHHMEIFYDFLHLNRELRDLDFKHNLEEKQKLVERAEALADEPDLNKAFRELQTLHKIWKEDIGPVAKEHREEIWEKFSNATKAMHQRRQEHFQELEKVYEKNLEKKQEIIAGIAKIAENVADNHRGIQQQIKEVEALRESFFKAGKVPQKVNEETWGQFKETVRKFNRTKNAFYKNQKKEQQQNLEKKRELLQLAVSLKDSDDWAEVTPQMKRIQRDWKKIGHVPRKYSDKIWKEFKDACNHYFDRLHAERNDAHNEEFENFKKKSECLDRLKAFQLSGDKKKDIEDIKAFLSEWKQYGRIPYNKKHINGKFNKIVDALFKKLGIAKEQSELLKYGNKVQELAKTEDNYAIGNERIFVKRKIDEVKSEIRQLENNLQFFSNDSEDNPLVKEVVQKLNKQKEALQTWKEKMKNLNILEHKLNKESEEEETEGSEEEE
ncbi:MAG: DUF349 domain-containing protein [Muricauda sp.]|nr:DUF349 domain-containing protein [Allomuricauda sp.]MBO6588815.1 DUF349 domain-containing protein [Allomuricauda sp.]MBO6618046.1 DUF349 domain-containing protein [Allomuricauda sp.]MBO6644353.1 DUF349 domain-containing protein [Allomuricauda sp.]MBO6747930.1 DUF349 domain-containing protein [Allomuricauda sp.]MBO6844343.1 DUF349 domain-containing protein [Allomuricauda sp.]